MSAATITVSLDSLAALIEAKLASDRLAVALAGEASAHPVLTGPAAVEALAYLICEHEQDTTPAYEVARRLIATGRVQVTS